MWQLETLVCTCLLNNVDNADLSLSSLLLSIGKVLNILSSPLNCCLE